MLRSSAQKYMMALTALLVAAAGLVQASRFALSPKLAVMAAIFTGGLIIATALVHLLGEASASDVGGFPWACTLLGVGYGSMLSMELLGEAQRQRPVLTEAELAPQRSTFELSSASGRDYCERDTLTSDALGSPSTPSSSSALSSPRHRTVDGSSIATVALVVHSVGDGVAIALQSSRPKLTAVGGAILVHKFFAASALGTLLTRATFERRRTWESKLLSAAVFTLATPVTIVTVVLCGEELPIMLDDNFVDRATALCAGSLLYVGIHEILTEALLDHNNNGPTKHVVLDIKLKLLLFWAGFGIMALLAVWV